MTESTKVIWKRFEGTVQAENRVFEQEVAT
jgi:hypothetical protein